MESDVKSMMARFQMADPSSASPPSFAPRRQKAPLHHSRSSGSPSPSRSPSAAPSPFLLPRKPISEGGTGGTLPPKPTFKGPSPGGPEPAKALAARFSAANEEPDGGGKPFPRSAPEPAGPKPKLQKPHVSATLPEARPAPVVPTAPKPSWVRAGGPGGGGGSGGGGVVSNQGSVPKPPPTQQKPSSGVSRLRLQGERQHGNALASRLPAGFTIGASVPPRDAKEKVEQASAAKTGQPPPNTTDTRNAIAAPPKPLASKKTSFVRRQVDALVAPQSAGQDGAPRRNPLRALLGPAPAKPSRPPRVNLDRFRGDARGSVTPMVPPPLASHPGNHSDSGPNLPSSVQPVPPSLPPRHIEPDLDESYDDVGVMNNAPPPPPSTAGRPRLSMQDNESDGEMYEELDERWEAADLKKDKEDKKRQEAEKKEQKEREKKEQDARKKYKLVGPLEVMHQAKVLVDSRGSKTDLVLKKGERVDIIRIQDNPGGKWLGRLENGSFGYLKNDYVEVDLQSWKQSLGSKPVQEMEDPEMYDDVDVSNDHRNSSSGIKGTRVVLPPPPDEDGDIYDDALDASLDVREAAKSAPKTLLLRMFERKKPASSTNELPPPSLFSAEGNSGALFDEELYDDIDSLGGPPPLPLSSPPTQQPKTEEIDPKRQKKFEKEEKEFRKKFKYEGDITVLYKVTIIPTLTMKKFSGKDLPVKPGDTLDVIVKAVDNKLICRDAEGKFGTVLTNHVVTDDGEIYDDIGDDCIYDND